MHQMAVNSKKHIHHQTIKQQSGLMLIEVLVSILLLSIGILGVVALQAKAMQTSGNAENRIIASNLANDIVSQMWLRKTSDPTEPTLATDITKGKKRVTDSHLPSAQGTVVKSGDVTTVAITFRAPSKKTTENSSQYATQVVIPN